MADFYQILGVSRDADADTLKSAYRKLARQYHPDVNKDPGAEDKFKEIGKAYEALADPETRARYDQFGEADGSQVSSLFYAAFVLMILSLVVNIFAQWLVKKFSLKY